MAYGYMSGRSVWLTSDNFDTPLMEQPMVSGVPPYLPLAERAYEALDEDPTFDEFNARFMPQPIAPVIPKDVPLQGRARSDANEAPRGIFGEHIVSSPTSFLTSCSHHEPVTVSTPHVTPRVYSGGAENLPKDHSCRRLKHPTKEDWQRWRPGIVRRYQHGGAPDIVKQFRLDGYNVTEKMLRDRLCMWRANTKQTRSARTAVSSVEPSRAMDTSAANFRERHVLREIERFFSVSWQSSRPRREADRHGLKLLESFWIVAFPAIQQGSRRAWKSLRKLADEIAEFDWSLMSGFNIIALTEVAMPMYYYNVLQPMMEIWTNLLFRNLQQSHPIALLLKYLLSSPGSDHPRCLQALLAMHESKVLIYGGRHEQDNHIASARARIASALIDLGQYTQAAEILYHYTIPAHVHTTANIARHGLCNIFQTLGESSYLQHNYEHAAQHFRRAKSLDDRKSIDLTIATLDYLVNSLARIGQIIEVRVHLQELVDHLAHKAMDLKLNENPKYFALVNPLKALCESLAKFEELRDIVGELEGLHIFKDIDDEDWR